jgi:hypothetical protein
MSRDAIRVRSTPRSVADYRSDPFTLQFFDDGALRIEVVPAASSQRDRETVTTISLEAMERLVAEGRRVRDAHLRFVLDQLAESAETMLADDHDWRAPHNLESRAERARNVLDGETRTLGEPIDPETGQPYPKRRVA